MAKNTSVNPAILAAALEGLERQRERIIAQISAVRAQLGATPPSRQSETSAAEPKPKRELSAAARERIAEAQRKRRAAARKAAKN